MGHRMSSNSFVRCTMLSVLCVVSASQAAAQTATPATAAWPSFEPHADCLVSTTLAAGRIVIPPGVTVWMSDGAMLWSDSDILVDGRVAAFDDSGLGGQRDGSSLHLSARELITLRGELVPGNGLGAAPHADGATGPGGRGGNVILDAPVVLAAHDLAAGAGGDGATACAGGAGGSIIVTGALRSLDPLAPPPRLLGGPGGLGGAGNSAASVHGGDGGSGGLAFILSLHAAPLGGALAGEQPKSVSNGTDGASGADGTGLNGMNGKKGAICGAGAPGLPGGDAVGGDGQDGGHGDDTSIPFTQGGAGGHGGNGGNAYAGNGGNGGKGGACCPILTLHSGPGGKGGAGAKGGTAHGGNAGNGGSGGRSGDFARGSDGGDGGNGGNAYGDNGGSGANGGIGTTQGNGGAQGGGGGAFGGSWGAGGFKGGVIFGHDGADGQSGASIPGVAGQPGANGKVCASLSSSSTTMAPSGTGGTPVVPPPKPDPPLLGPLDIFSDTVAGGARGEHGEPRIHYVATEDHLSLLRFEPAQPEVTSIFFSLAQLDDAEAFAGQGIATVSVDATGTVWVLTSAALLELSDLNGDGDAQDPGEMHALLVAGD